ncbi:hypothetical protein A9Q99_23600 [Gammaproteobacteria bacterium 45_16_T64]|nr:hypothetical protein A9Q99_23600 [Gammaproteobacteria bacterium 45_16_T64]
MHKGYCQCCSIQYRIINDPFDCCYCHCSICRRLTGSAMGAYGSVPKHEFSWIQGEELLTRYQQNTTTTRLFCSSCGSFLLTTHSADKQNVFITLGCLDSEMESGPEYHQFMGSKASWENNHDAIAQHDAWPEWRITQLRNSLKKQGTKLT